MTKREKETTLKNKIIILLSTCALFACGENDAWNVKRDKGVNTDKNYLVTSTFKQEGPDTIGYHRIAINSNVRSDDHEAFMVIDISRTNDFCDDITKTLKTKGNIEWTWQLCEGYNSARVSAWIMDGSKRIDLDSEFIEEIKD